MLIITGYYIMATTIFYWKTECALLILAEDILMLKMHPLLILFKFLPVNFIYYSVRIWFITNKQFSF